MKHWYKEQDALLQEIESTHLTNDELALWYLGQCGFALKHQEKLLLVDPVLNDLLDPLGHSRRHYPPGMDPAKLKADYVWITHSHRDHMALPTLQKLFQANPNLLVLAPQETCQAMKEAGLPPSQLLSLQHLSRAQMQNLSFEALRTAHPTWNLEPGQPERSLAMDLHWNGFHILHPGDTYLCDEVLEAFASRRPYDLFFPPINGGDYFRTARGCIGNLNPLEAALLSQKIEADLTIPTHYDMMSGNTCSPLPFVEAMEEYHPKGRWALPKLGERLILKRN